jgi:hypothetical protein
MKYKPWVLYKLVKMILLMKNYKSKNIIKVLSSILLKIKTNKLNWLKIKKKIKKKKKKNGKCEIK